MFTGLVRARFAGFGIALLVAVSGLSAHAEIIVDSSGPYRLGASQQGSQFAPSVTPFGGNGAIGAWASPGGAGAHPFVGYYSIFGSPSGTPIELGGATGPTAGAGTTSTAAVSFSDASSLVLFAAKPRTGANTDIFAQQMSAFRSKVGVPVRVNQVLPGIQTQLFAVPLSSGMVLATWQSRTGGASTYDLRGRVVNGSGGGTLHDVAVTANTAGPQTESGLAALTNGNSVIAYFVRTGSGASAKQSAYLQRLGPSGARIGVPKLIKQTIGPNTYGGIGVAALPAGRYMALWFVSAPGGKAALRRQIFQTTGAAGPVVTLGTTTVKPTAQNAPRPILGKEGVTVAFDDFAGGAYRVNALVLNNSGALIAAAKTLGSSTSPLASTALTYDPTNKLYYLSWTQKISASLTHSFADTFYVSKGCSVKC